MHEAYAHVYHLVSMHISNLFCVIVKMLYERFKDTNFTFLGTPYLLIASAAL